MSLFLFVLPFVSYLWTKYVQKNDEDLIFLNEVVFSSPYVLFPPTLLVWQRVGVDRRGFRRGLQDLPEGRKRTVFLIFVPLYKFSFFFFNTMYTNSQTFTRANILELSRPLPFLVRSRKDYSKESSGEHPSELIFLLQFNYLPKNSSLHLIVSVEMTRVWKALEHEGGNF